MRFKNTDNASIEYYKGIIRTTDAKLKNALGRIKKLEEAMKKLEKVTFGLSDNIDAITPAQENAFILTQEEQLKQAGLDFESDSFKEAVEEAVNDAMERGVITIPPHDHTAPDKGGDAFAGKGASLQ